jgi:zinc protease
MVAARIKNQSDVDYVRDQIVATFEQYKRQRVPSERLEAVKSHMKYGFAMSLDNSQAIAAALAPYVVLTGEPESINRLFETYARIDTGDIQGMANKYFDTSRMTTVTLSQGQK